MSVTERDVRRLTTTLVSAVVVLTAYWILWATARSVVASEHSGAYYEFENAFPLADAWLGTCALLAVWSARTRRASTLLWILCGGGAGIYLACMDVLYDIENGIYGRGGGGIIELCINVITVVVSAWTLRWGWLRRSALLQWGRDQPDTPAVRGAAID